jgi:phospholipid transport system transporter-binding protein
MATIWSAPSRLVHDTVPQALSQAQAAVARGADVIDLAAVHELDSSAVAMLVELKRSRRKQGKALDLVNSPEGLKALARLYEVEAMLS